ncbi:hypothetical protein [Mucilaginibacter pocheonensis]|uniref:Oligosaccharide repeat unit polymerase n=1 Tax=Mucilaginibacter pocheonensis TaxID=398050 RepID=A0ABU1T714_9SPHI|nr:hypothetical protein [Mucilaginibacter pocheonensis]MDR6941181.1 hypothetical protein [Mucilaginibacter pocheonensis]
MEELVFSLNLVSLFIIGVCIFTANYFLLKRYIFFWFDPLLVYTIFNSFSIAFVIYLFFVDKQIKEFYLITYLLSTIGLLTGLIIGSEIALRRISVAKKTINKTVLSNYDQVFEVFLVICLFIVVTSNLIMLASVGTLPILSADPSKAKVELYTGGWGIIRRIDLMCVNFIFSIALLKLFHPLNEITKKKKIFCWLSILIGTLILFTMGSKSSLIGILNSLFGVAMINLYFGKNIFEGQRNMINISTIKTFGKYALIIGLAYMFLIILKDGVETNALNVFITRMVGSGDTFYFFYVYDLYDNFKLNPIDYIVHVVNPILGFFRIVPYEYPVGAYILLYALGVPLGSFGPNAQHPIEGLLYFGKTGTFFYSLAIGVLIARMRISLLNRALDNPNFLQLIIYISIASIAVNPAIEVDFFLLLFYDIFMFGTIIFLISLTLVNYVKKTRNLPTA